MATARKTTIESDLDAARAAFEAVDGPQARRIRQLGLMELARSIAQESPEETNRVNVYGGDDLRAAREAAVPFVKQFRASPRKFAQALDDLRDDIAAAQADLVAAREAYDVARTRETSRIAVSLQPRQKEIARRLAEHLSAISRLISDEEALHGELARSAPNPASPFLPNIVEELGEFRLGDWSSRVSAWVRRMNKLGIME